MHSRGYAVAMATSEPLLLDAVSLACEAVDELIVQTVRDTHHAVADRVHGLLGRPTAGWVAGPAVLHRAVSASVYAGIGAGLRTAGRGLSAAGALGLGPGLEESPRGRRTTAAVHGIIGDRIRDERPRLAITMAVRRHHRDVPLRPDSVAAAFPGAGPRIAVLLHGMSESDDAWDAGAARGEAPYDATLAALGWTVVRLRANTGLALRENGVLLSALLRDLVRAWPVPVEEIALLAHSMGGLIVRAACAVVADDPDPWADRVTEVVTLGTPHLGAPLAGGVGRAAVHFARLPETRALGRILDRRAVGVDDLVEGLAEDVPALPHARYRLVAATLTEDPRHPVGRWLGDLLVRVPSAHGEGRVVRLFPDAETLHVGRAHHFTLLNDARVHEALRGWLAR